MINGFYKISYKDNMDTKKINIESKVWSKICFKKYSQASEIIESNKINPDYKQSGKPLMHLIAKTLEVDLAKKLLDMGADINIEDDWGKVPLGTALSEYEKRDFENDSMIKFLIENGAGKDTNGNYIESIEKQLKRIRQVLKVIAPNKVEKLNWLNID